MLINGVAEYARDGSEVKTALVAGRATGAGEMKQTQSGKHIANVSVKAFGRKDGSAAFLTVKSWNDGDIQKISSLKKGDAFLAAGRLDSREYNGKTYTDLIADIVLTGDYASAAAGYAGDAIYTPTVSTGSFEEIGDGEEVLPF